jgi:hypothetical protein
MANKTTKTTSSSSSFSTHHVDGTPVVKTTTTSYVTSTPVVKTTVHRTVGGVTTTSTSETVGEPTTKTSSYTTEHGGKSSSTKTITEGSATPITTTTTEYHTAGGSRTAGISQESALLLEKALQDEANYSKHVTVRIRVFQIRSVTKQVVSGTNYRYEVVGARESSTNGTEITSADAAKAVYAITVYEQTWTNTLQVTGIERLNKDVNAPVEVPVPAGAVVGGYGAVHGLGASSSAAAPGTKKVTSFLASIDSWFS